MRENLEDYKRMKMLDIINQFIPVDSYRTNKNDYSKENIKGFTFLPRRVTFKPSIIDYILISKHLEAHSKKLEVKILPRALIKSDHDMLKMTIVHEQVKRSKNERRKYFRFPDHLIENDRFMNLMVDKIYYFMKDVCGGHLNKMSSNNKQK